MINKKIKAIVCIIISFFSLTVSPLSVFALNSIGIPDASTLDFYNANGIFFYNPAGNGYNMNCLPGNNLGYNGSNVIDDTRLQRILENQPFYEEAASKYGFDWRILAAIHYRESGNSTTNPANNNGVYQVSNTNYTPGKELSDQEFRDQTDEAAQFIINKASGLNLNDPEDIKLLFFKYNGASDKYKSIALAMNFSEEQANRGEGSPFVMNWYDGRRDPRSEEWDRVNWIGGYVNKLDENNRVVGSEWDNTRVDANAGAFTVYVALGGNDSQSSSFCYPAFGGGALVEGGMTMEQAEIYMNTYRNLDQIYTDAQLNELYGMIIGRDNVANGFTAIHNCVAFVQYFLKESTTPPRVWGLPDGRLVAGYLINNFPDQFTEITAPQPYAVFSRSSGTSWCVDKVTGESIRCGHTGVILGIQGDTVITGEAHYNSSPIDVKTYTVSEFMNYPDVRLALPNNLFFDTIDGNIIAGNDATISGSGDNITLTIPGLSKTYRIAWVSDAHVQDPNDSDTNRFEGRTISQINTAWDNSINSIINGRYDAVIFGGDLMDYYSSSTSAIIQRGFDKLKNTNIPWIYIYGASDHDRNNSKGDAINESIFNSGSSSDYIDLGDIAIIGLNDSANSNTSTVNSIINTIETANKPVILATHVPFDSQNNSVREDIKKPQTQGGRGSDYLWTPGGSRWNLNSNSSMNNFAENFLYQESNVKLVLTGHVHVMSSSYELSNNKKGAKEHIFQGNYRGSGPGTITVKGN